MDEHLTFYAALTAVAQGQRITKLEWGDKEYWGQMFNGFLMLHKPDGKYYFWNISDGDMAGDDWVVMTPDYA